MIRKVQIELLNCVYGTCLIIANLVVTAACKIKTRQSYLMLKHPKKQKILVKEVKNEVF